MVVSGIQGICIYVKITPRRSTLTSGSGRIHSWYQIFMLLWWELDGHQLVIKPKKGSIHIRISRYLKTNWF